MTAVAPTPLQASRTLVDTSVLGLADEGQGWHPLPDWARYHIEAGLAVGRLETGGVRCVLAIVVPARDYAAVLCAAGVVLAAYERESSLDAARVFGELSALPSGTPLTLREKGRIKRGRLVGTRNNRLGVQVENSEAGGLTQWIPRGQVWRVAQADRETSQLPKRQRGRKVQAVSGFAMHVLDPLDAVRFTEPGKSDCLIVGSRRSIREDVLQPGFATKPRGARRITPGTLNDLLRVAGTPGIGDAHRTDVLSAQSLSSLASRAVPTATVFDGAAGYLRWRDRLGSSHAIVILDRTEHRYTEAAQHLHRDYVRRTQDDPLLVLPSPPPGVEILRFSQADR